MTTIANTGEGRRRCPGAVNILIECRFFQLDDSLHTNESTNNSMLPSASRSWCAWGQNPQTRRAATASCRSHLSRVIHDSGNESMPSLLPPTSRNSDRYRRQLSHMACPFRAHRAEVIVARCTSRCMPRFHEKQSPVRQDAAPERIGKGSPARGSLSLMLRSFSCAVGWARFGARCAAPVPSCRLDWTSFRDVRCAACPCLKQSGH